MAGADAEVMGTVQISSRNENHRRLFQRVQIEDDSVIMISSAETTLINNNPSPMALSAIYQTRPSTRLSHVDMTLEETARRTLYRGTKSYAPDETDLSITNIVQTPVMHRGRPKSSMVTQRMKSRSGFAIPEENDAARPSRSQSRTNASEELSTVSKRARTASTKAIEIEQDSGEVQNGRKSLVNSELERTEPQESGNSSGDEENHVSLRGQQNQSSSESASMAGNEKLTSETKQVLTTRRLRIRSVTSARKLIESRPRTRSVSKREEVALNLLNPEKGKSKKKHTSADAKTPSDINQHSSSQTSKVATGRKQKVAPAVVELEQESSEFPSDTSNSKNASSKVPAQKERNKFSETANKINVSDPDLETISNRRKKSKRVLVSKEKVVEQKTPNQSSDSSETVGVVHKRKGRNLKQNQAISGDMPLQNTTDDNASDTSPRVSQRKRRPNPKYFSKSPEKEAYSSYEKPLKNAEIVQFSNVSTRKRPKPDLDKNQNNIVRSNKVFESSPPPDSNSHANKKILKESRTKSKSPPIDKNQSKNKPDNGSCYVPMENRSSAANTSEDNSITKTMTKRRRLRKKDVTETPHSAAPTSSIRTRSKSVQPPATISQRANTHSKSVSGTAAIEPTHDVPQVHHSASKTPPATARQSRQRSRTQTHTTDSDVKQSRTRSKSVQRNTVLTNGKPVRGQSVSREVLLSPVHRAHNAVIDHVPIYRQHATQVQPSAPEIAPLTVRKSRERARTRTRTTNSDAKQSRTRGKSVQRNAKLTNGKPTRSHSVPREVLLSPVHRAHNAPGDHAPIYRQHAAQELPRSNSFSSLILLTEPIKARGEDVYEFDLSDVPVNDGKAATATKGNTAKKKPRSASNSRKRMTPAKHDVKRMFGTDMQRINEVVKRIGGGLVQQPLHCEAGPAVTANTAALESLVQRNPSNFQRTPISRSNSPVSNNDAGDDHHDFNDNDFNAENIPTVEMPVPVSPPKIVNPQIRQIIQKNATASVTPDKTQPNATLNFSPLGASSPWRVQNEQILPKTFYFSRSKDLLPSYESDVVRHANNNRMRPPTKDIEVMAAPAPPPRKTSPTKQPSRPPKVPSAERAEIMFQNIQKSYEQLKVTSEMSNKLIDAMRKYKTNVHNQTASFIDGPDGLPEDERLIAKFREYEANMKRTYQKLKQWYERSRQTLRHSIKTIKKVSAVPQTQAQKEVLENFRRDSERFFTMITELETAMNDSNIENISPEKTARSSRETVFTDIIIRDGNNSIRNPLKVLSIINDPPTFATVGSPLVKASYSVFSNGDKQNPSMRSKRTFGSLSLTKPSNFTKPQVVPVNIPSVIEIADTFIEPHQLDNSVSSANSSSASLNDWQPPKVAPPEKDLFGFEADEVEEQIADPTPMKITRETLKERLESVRKLLPQRPPSRTQQIPTVSRKQPQMPNVFGSPRKLRTIKSAFTSTPLAEKKKRTEQGKEPEPNVSLIASGQEEARDKEAEKADSPPAALFSETLSTSFANRTYTRVPRRNHKRKRNIYLADLGLSDEEDQSQNSATEAEEDSDEKAKKKRRKQQKKKRRVAASKKNNAVEETNEFQQFVSEFNSMCDQVNRYQLVIEKPVNMQRA